jgi:hypothetical protein
MQPPRKTRPSESQGGWHGYKNCDKEPHRCEEVCTEISPAAGKKVEQEMKAMKQGKLKSGRSGKTVTNPKQAIAIGLSEARKEGAKVPPREE